jgi:SET domain-containing protein
MENLEIRTTENKGRGVFAKKDFELKETIEICPLIVMDEKEEFLIKKTRLKDYYFQFENGDIALALGYGSIYNHKKKPNAKYLIDEENPTLVIKCAKRIKKGDEITVNYNGSPKSKSPVWFEIKD